MPITAQSADGMSHQFPDGTADAVIDKAMKDYATKAAQPPETMGTISQAADIGIGAVKGLAESAEAFPGAAASLIGMAGRGLESLGVGDQQRAAQREQFLRENPRPTLSANLPAPTTKGGEYARSIAGFVPGVATGGGSWISGIATALFGGAGAQAASDLVADPGDEPYARIIGGLASLIPSMFARTVTPLPVTPRQAAATANLAREGVTDLTAGQATGRRALRYAEEHLGGSPFSSTEAEERLTRPLEQFTRAALRRIGEAADRATPQVINRAHTRIGNQFDALAARTNARIDQQYLQDIFTAQNEYDHLFVDPLRRPIVENVIDHALNQVVGSRTMTGAQYQALRSRLARQRRGTNDPEVGQFLGSVNDAMDNLFERNIARTNPADLGAWREVRSQYRNLLAIESATTGMETAGIITPAKLKQAAVKQSRSQYARGLGAFGNLARSGEQVLGALPQSGTAPRSLTSAGVTKLLSTGVTGRALMSPPVQAWLANQTFANVLPQLPGPSQAAIQSIIAEGLRPSGNEAKAPLRLTVGPSDKHSFLEQFNPISSAQAAEQPPEFGRSPGMRLKLTGETFGGGGGGGAGGSPPRLGFRSAGATRTDFGPKASQAEEILGPEKQGTGPRTPQAQETTKSAPPAERAQPTGTGERIQFRSAGAARERGTEEGFKSLEQARHTTEQEEIKRSIKPLTFWERFDRDTKNMTRQELMDSEALWGRARQYAEANKTSFTQAYRQLFDRAFRNKGNPLTDAELQDVMIQALKFGITP